MKIVQTLPDGTRILSNGFKLLPPIANGKKLNDMTDAERKAWNDRLMKHLSENMTAFYRKEGLI